MQFLSDHWLDITTTILGLAYILLEYRASIWMWAVGAVMQLLGIVLYYQKGLYADCGMEFYYLGMTAYGFIMWRMGKPKESKELPICHFEKKYILPSAKAINIKPIQLLNGSPVDVDPNEEGNQNQAESLDMSFE